MNRKEESIINIKLPTPIEKYFYVDRKDGMAVAQCFTNNGIVIDEGIERKGHTAIAQWRNEASSAYEYTVEPFSVQECGDTIIVISAEGLGAVRCYNSNEPLPRKVDVVVDNVGPATWGHSLDSVVRNGTIILAGLTTGHSVELPLLKAVSQQISLLGTVMGTRNDMINLINFIETTGIVPHIGNVFPMREATEAFRLMWSGALRGKIVFTL